MSNEQLIPWDEIESRISTVKDFSEIKKMDAGLEAFSVIAKQDSGSIKAYNQIMQYRIQLHQTAGEMYSKLESMQGRRDDIDTSSTDFSKLTNKQSAKETLGKSGQTLSNWVRALEVDENGDLLQQYIANCNTVDQPASEAGFIKFAGDALKQSQDNGLVNQGFDTEEEFKRALNKLDNLYVTISQLWTREKDLSENQKQRLINAVNRIVDVIDGEEEK
jgi:hypothetical protein